MNNKLLNNTLLMVTGCIVLVIICYYYVDKPVADFFFRYHSANKPVAEFFFGNPALGKSENWLSFIVRWSVLIEYLPPFIAIFFIIKHNVSQYLSKNEKIFMVIALNMTLATSIKNILKFVFGRYWPKTWMGGNPSWLQSHQYGFHFFHSGSAYNSFPSGHATAIFAMMTIVWMVYPKWRWLCVISCLSMAISLIVLNYHFVSDVIAGMFLGIITGQNATYYFLRSEKNRIFCDKIIATNNKLPKR